MEAGKFNELKPADKAWLLYEFGDYLFSIEYYDHRISLYSLNTNLVEMYQNIDTNEIVRISIANYGDLDKYLSRIIIGSAKQNIKG